MNKKEHEDILNYAISRDEIQKSAKATREPVTENGAKALNNVDIQKTNLNDEEENKENAENLSKNVCKFYGTGAGKPKPKLNAENLGQNVRKFYGTGSGKPKPKFVFKNRDNSRGAQMLQLVKKKPLFPGPESPKFHPYARKRPSTKEKLKTFLPKNEISRPFQTSGWEKNFDFEKTSQIRPKPIPTLATRSETGMVGLVNLNNTCYMNSVIQALYMSPM